MLWRPTYAPLVLENIAAPPLKASSLAGTPLNTDGAVIGSFSPESIEVGIWQKLLGEDAHTVYFVQPEAIPEVEAVTPPSRFEKVGTALPTPEWHRLIAPDRASRAFAMITRKQQTILLVIGAPTEEVWERFEKLLNTE